MTTQHDPSKNHENALLAFLADLGQPATRQEIVRSVGCSWPTIAKAVSRLLVHGVLHQTTVVGMRGQTAFAYTAQTAKKFKDRRGRVYYTAPCPGCGKRRRLRRMGSMWVLWHDPCQIIQRVKVGGSENRSE